MKRLLGKALAEEEGSDILRLGGNIELAGFRSVDRGKMVVVKKMVGQYAKLMSERAENFEKLHVVISGSSEAFALEAKMLHNGGREIASQGSDANLFFALDKCLGKITEQLD
ncbi:hypothetical protein HYS48_02205 [Candidatus Woesearchaeota archaeon]|nr:hypothetical protein [Candidatus Woesearchaeota archaeon]